MGERGQMGGPNGSDWESAPSIIAMLELDVRPGRVSLLVPVAHGAVHGSSCAIPGPCSAMRLPIC